MLNPTEKAIAVLNDYAIWSTETHVSSSLLEALVPLLPIGEEQKDVASHVVLATEAVLVANNTNKLLLARLCALLQRLTNLKPSQVATALASAAPELIRSVSWVAKLVRAGNLLLDHPALADVENIDKLATLSRIPKKLQQTIFDSGRLPNGVAFRELDRKALAEAVDRLRNGPSVLPQPHREARKELLRLVRSISPIVEQLSLLPEFAPLLAKLSAWQNEIVSTVETMPIPRRLPASTGAGDLLSA